MKMLTVVGARPQFIKAAPVSRALAAAGVEERLVHTGQHYDFAMSELFFQQLRIPPPAEYLGLGGGTHGKMTGDMLAAVESLLLEGRPDAVLVYGDTNSTLAGALAAAKLNIPVIHIEAGLRSWNRRMPEEINRVLTDHVAALLFCSSEEGVTNLAREGITAGVEVCGDVMADAALEVRALLKDAGFALRTGQNLPDLPPDFDLMTLHRAENTDSRERLSSILEGIAQSGRTILFPVHPRTAKAIADRGLTLPANVQPLSPVGYFEMCLLLQRCRMVLTDSGGLQKEAYWFERPCLTLRDETEWVETLNDGWNTLTGANAPAITRGLLSPKNPGAHRPLYGDGAAAARIARSIRNRFQF